jgi:hypothetical protein
MKTFFVNDVAAERDRALRTIASVENALTLYGVPITAPLGDAVLEILHERDELRRELAAIRAAQR